MSPQHRPLDVVFLVDEPSITKSLVGTIESDESIGTVRAVSPGQVATREGASEPDVVSSGLNPQPTNSVEENVISKDSLAFVVASDISEQTYELGAAVAADGYLKGGPGCADIAPLMVALASVCSGRPNRLGR